MIANSSTRAQTSSHLYGIDPLALFSMYMQVTGVPSLKHSGSGDPVLLGKTLGILNGSSWITLWSNYFGRLFLPEVRLVNVGNEATQLNFMRAHSEGQKCPPDDNVETFARYAEDLVRLYGVDAILISCSTMNRSYHTVQKRVESYDVPVAAIDMPMMERAIELGRSILVVATHGPTVDSTRLLLEEVAAQRSKPVSIHGATVEKAFELLGSGRIADHNEVIASAIRETAAKEHVDVVVLAQLSMSVFKLSYPDAQSEFGIPVLTSGEEGFGRMREVLAQRTDVERQV